ncbi:hypothetical protein BVH03_23200 [Pseudomonas sp. PA15(2017)]|nr:hypothetical protein BVH03_23200 [Pseudomonas sp. PA15(2017)]
MFLIGFLSEAVIGGVSVGTGGDAQSMPAIFRAHGALPQWINEPPPRHFATKIGESGPKIMNRF